MSLTRLFGLFSLALLCSAIAIPKPVALPFLVVAIVLGLVALGVSPPCAGEEVALSTLATRADERGVMLPFAVTALTGAPAAFALGVPGADLTVGDGLEATDVAEGVALAATRGVSGVRAVRFEASVGFNGLGVLRSVDIGVTDQSWQARLSSCAQSHGLQKQG